MELAFYFATGLGCLLGLGVAVWSIVDTIRKVRRRRAIAIGVLHGIVSVNESRRDRFDPEWKPVRMRSVPPPPSPPWPRIIREDRAGPSKLRSVPKPAPDIDWEEF